MQRSILIILNPQNGDFEVVEQAAAHVRERGHRVETCVSQSADDALRLAARGAEDEFDVVVAVGGDGTINQIACGIAASKGQAAVGIVPRGTGNDFAKICGIPVDDVYAALMIAAESRIVSIDLASANGAPFINMATGGFPAEITTDTTEDAKRLLGSFSYVLSALSNMAEMRASPVKVTGPSIAFEGELLALAVGNGRQAGGGFRVCPQALLDDGLLDVLLVPKAERDHVLSWLRDMMNVTRATAEYTQLTYVQVPWLEVEAPGGIQVNLDGEPLHADRFTFSVKKRHVRFCLPEGAPAQQLEAEPKPVGR